jgi:hypothetical protein
LTFSRKDIYYLMTVTTVSPLTVVNPRSSPASPPTLGFLLICGKYAGTGWFSINQGKDNNRCNKSMARPVKKKSSKRKRGGDRSLPLAKINYMLLIVGAGVILAGLLFMLEGSVDGTMPIVIAPLLLVIGYCILIPFALLYRRAEGTGDRSDSSSQS